MRWLAQATLCGCVFCGMPFTASAAVVISEIAWMGSVDSANDEWIEIHNTGESISLDGWTLTDGVNFNIALSGTIGSGAYAILERTDDSSAPGGAFLIYTGALTNAGATLSLLRPDGGIEDQVSGGENWGNIGGNNDTKETPQYTGSGWVTNAATPGAANMAQSSEPVSVTEADTERSNSHEAAPEELEEVTIHLPDPELALTFELPSTVYVNQPVTFAVEPEGISNRLLASVSVDWNFGDLSTASGREVSHAYAYPGEYVVAIRGAFARHEATARHKIIVLPVTLSIARTAEGDVHIHNNARYELDLSGYVLRGTRTASFPEGTILLSQATLTIPGDVIGVGMIPVLFGPGGTIVGSHESKAPTAKQPTPASPEPVSAAREPEFEFASEGEVDASAIQTVVAPIEETSDAPEQPVHSWPFVGLVGVTVAGMAALAMGRRSRETGPESALQPQLFDDEKRSI